MNEIRLKFDNGSTGLAGNDFGQQTFKDQILPYLKDAEFKSDTKIALIFPPHIRRVAISFTQGLTAEIANKVGRSNLPAVLEIQTGRESLTSKIYKDMIASL